MLKSGSGTAVMRPAYIKEKIRHDAQEIVPRRGDSIGFEAEVTGTKDQVPGHGWGSKALVLEASFLRQKIRAEADAVVGK